MEERLLILDGNSILYRSYFALPKLKTKEGTPTNAIYGFFLIFFKLIREIKPTHLIVCFDAKGKTFRHEEFEQYKIQRKKPPSDLVLQSRQLKSVLEKGGIFFYEKEGFEADDLIASVCEKFKHIEKIIVSLDSDLFQLINENTKVCFLKRKGIEVYDKRKLKEEYKIDPEKFAYYKALVGDLSDNIPGVEGIGIKKAVEILEKIEDFENFFSGKEIWKLNQRDREILIKNKERILTNLSLVCLRKDLNLNFDLRDCQIKKIKKEGLKEAFKKLEFSSLAKRVEEIDC